MGSSPVQRVGWKGTRVLSEGTGFTDIMVPRVWQCGSAAGLQAGPWEREVAPVLLPSEPHSPAKAELLQRTAMSLGVGKAMYSFLNLLLGNSYAILA